MARKEYVIASYKSVDLENNLNKLAKRYDLISISASDHLDKVLCVFKSKQKEKNDSKK